MRKRFGFTPLERKLRTLGGVKNVQRGWCLKPHLSPVRDKSLNGVSFLTGFTIVELLTVLVIIAILVGLLIPAMSMVRRIAKETAQKHQLTTIDMALMAFKNDYGDYPPSEWRPAPPPPEDYCGAQKLAEALLGWDLMGFHPDSAWRADGYDGLTPSGPWTYDPDKVRDNNIDGVPDTLEERRGPYLELATTNAFRLGNIPVNKPGLFDDIGPVLEPDTFVICDVFGVKKIPIGGKMVKAGTPILYYKANTSSKTMDPSVAWNDRIYSAYDNLPLIDLGKIGDGQPHWNNDYIANFYSEKGVLDPKVNIDWPYRPDSYILISAGADGLYGTSDDIRNF